MRFTNDQESDDLKWPVIIAESLNIRVLINIYKQILRFPLNIYSCVKYTLNKNGILIRKSMFIAHIMGLLTKEKNTTKNIL